MADLERRSTLPELTTQIGVADLAIEHGGALIENIADEFPYTLPDSDDPVEILNAALRPAKTRREFLYGGKDSEGHPLPGLIDNLNHMQDLRNQWLAERQMVIDDSTEALQTLVTTGVIRQEHAHILREGLENLLVTPASKSDRKALPPAQDKAKEDSISPTLPTAEGALTPSNNAQKQKENDRHPFNSGTMKQKAYEVLLSAGQPLSTREWGERLYAQEITEGVMDSRRAVYNLRSILPDFKDLPKEFGFNINGQPRTARASYSIVLPVDNTDRAKNDELNASPSQKPAPEESESPAPTTAEFAPNPFEEGTIIARAYEIIRSKTDRFTAKELSLEIFSEEIADGSISEENARLSTWSEIIGSLLNADLPDGAIRKKIKGGSAVYWFERKQKAALPETEGEASPTTILEPEATAVPEEPQSSPVPQLSSPEGVGVDEKSEPSVLQKPEGIRLSKSQQEMDLLLRDGNTEGIPRSGLMEKASKKTLASFASELNLYKRALEKGGQTIVNLTPHKQGEPVYVIRELQPRGTTIEPEKDSKEETAKGTVAPQPDDEISPLRAAMKAFSEVHDTTRPAAEPATREFTSAAEPTGLTRGKDQVISPPKKDESRRSDTSPWDEIRRTTPEAELPKMTLDLRTFELTMGKNRKANLPYGHQVDLLRRLSRKKPLTLQELAGDRDEKDLGVLFTAERNFTDLQRRFESKPKNPQIFVITGHGKDKRFEMRANLNIIERE